jgi:hypothetical protein
MWGGNFNNIIDTAGRQTNIYDPLTTGATAPASPSPATSSPNPA